MINHITTWFELPVKDMERAKEFYKKVLETSFEDDEMGGFKMSSFNHDEGAVSGMLILGENYEPSKTGAVIYFNGGKELNEPLNRAIESGGEVVVPKMAINDGKCGHFAQFLDSEGNRVGLYSYPETTD